jgi:hypothetical protein
MPFVVECPFCNHRAQVPDRALGASGRCPKCSSHFTLAHASDQRLPEGVAPPTSDAGREADAAPVPRSGLAVAIAVAAAAADRPVLADGGAGADGASWDAHPSSQVGPAGLAGAAALLLAGAALFCAAFEPTCRLILPLAGLGLLIGLVGIGLGQVAVRPRRLLPLAGTITAGVLLVTALVFPALLGPTYERSRQRIAPNSSALRAIPLGGGPAAVDATDWVDASRFALQQGGRRVQVISVSLGPIPGKAAAKKAAPEQFLLVRVRAQQVLAVGPSMDWHDGAADFGKNHLPVLMDSAGRAYAIQETKLFRPVDTSRKSSLFPVAAQDEVIAFEPPPTGVEWLRLEIPAAAWGGTGTFRFMIPATMISAGPAGPAVATPRGGN